MDQAVVSGDTPDFFKKKKPELEINTLAIAPGTQTRARARFIEAGEKNTRYFLGLEKVQAAAETIASLKTDNDDTNTNQADPFA